MPQLPATDLLKITEITDEATVATFVLEPLSPGFGMTIGNSLRRVLLSSLEGAAVSYVRIEGVTHEFATVKGMKEDVVDLIINLKALRVRLIDPQALQATVKLQVKGAATVTAADFATSNEVEFADARHHLATLADGGKLVIELVIERGRGYVPAEQKPSEHRPLGTIAVDSIFTPIKKLHYHVDHTRVGGQTDFDKLTLQVTTDGTIHPRDAFAQANMMLMEHLQVIAGFVGQTVELGDLPAPSPIEAAPTPKARRVVKAKKTTAKP